MPTNMACTLVGCLFAGMARSYSESPFAGLTVGPNSFGLRIWHSSSLSTQVRFIDQ